MELKLANKKEITSAPSVLRKDRKLDWHSNANVKNLLDVVSSIIAAEYIEIAKKNKEIFKEGNYAGRNINNNC